MGLRCLVLVKIRFFYTEEDSLDQKVSPVNSVNAKLPARSNNPQQNPAVMELQAV